ncbi:MAG: ABC transporter ATP-binding protein [Planctomycetaceae bacterium]|nr:ABC transporter ATP-binding protein [Planctomycetaceae bacterium]
MSLHDVTKVHHRGETEVHALRGATGEVGEGQFTFLLGPSGSGKSTLLHLIGALDEPTSGEIEVSGRKLSQLNARDRDAYRRSDVGFIFQNFNLLKNLDAVENVLVPFLPTGVAPELRKRAIALLERVGLGNRLTHRPNHLSGGEQQRVAIARALLKRPKLILADEPTGELDTTTGAEIYRYLRELHAEEKTTVVVVTHDQSHIAPEDRVMRMRDGVFVED